jgi:hypothetical protein
MQKQQVFCLGLRRKADKTKEDRTSGGRMACTAITGLGPVTERILLEIEYKGDKELVIPLLAVPTLQRGFLAGVQHNIIE